MISISSLSTEYIQVEVTATVNGSSPYNPTGDQVQMAFVTSGDPVSGDWHSGAWQTISSSAGPVYLAQCLVGSGGVALAAGTYNVWLKITDSPEIPVRQIGLLQVT